MTNNLPPEIDNASSPSQLKEYAKNNIFYFMTKIIKKKLPYGTSYFPDTPFLLPFMINLNFKFTKKYLWYIWCETSLYIMYVIVLTKVMCNHIMDPKNYKSLTWTTLEWYFHWNGGEIN